MCVGLSTTVRPKLDLHLPGSLMAHHRTAYQNLMPSSSTRVSSWRDWFLLHRRSWLERYPSLCFEIVYWQLVSSKYFVNYRWHFCRKIRLCCKTVLYCLLVGTILPPLFYAAITTVGTTTNYLLLKHLYLYTLLQVPLLFWKNMRTCTPGYM